MPDYDDENYPLTSSKRFGSIRFRRSGIANKRRSELKATISGPHALGGGGASTISLDSAPLGTLNGARPLHHTNSASTVLNGLSPPQQIFPGGTRRNSDIPLRQYHSSLAWPSNHPAITPLHGSPYHPSRHKNPRKVDISKPLMLNSSRFSSAHGLSRRTSRRPIQSNRVSRSSETMTADTFKGNPDEVTPQGLSRSDQRALDSNLLDVPSDEFDPRTMMEFSPASNLDLRTTAASFGSVKLRTRKIDKAMRMSRATLLPTPQEVAQPDLVYTDDSDAFSSPPSTPSTPVWETMAISSTPKAGTSLATKLALADVHAQIQAMIDSANRTSTIESGDHLAQDQVPSNTQRNDIPPSLRPSNPMYRSFPPLATTHRRSASSPPLGSNIYHAFPQEFRGGQLYRPISPVMSHKPAPPASPPLKTTSTTPTDLMNPATPTRNPSSDRSDSPSVYSQLSPSSQTGDITPTSSTTSSPDHPYAKSKHERLLAAISEGISSPTKPGPTAPSILESGNNRPGKAGLADPPHNAPALPMIVVTGANDDDLMYSESSFSIVDMYAGSVESFEVGARRRRSRTASSVSHIHTSSIILVLTTPQSQPRHAPDSPRLRNSVSFNSPRRSQVAWERPPASHEPPKRRISIFRPGIPSSFLSMSTLHEAAEANSTPNDRKSFYAAVGLKGLFRRSSSKVSLFGQAQAQASGAVDATGGGGETRLGSTSPAVPSTGPESGDGNLKGGWGLFRWKR